MALWESLSINNVWNQISWDIIHYMVLDLGHFLWYIWMVCKFLPSQYVERFVGTYNPRGQIKQLVEIFVGCFLFSGEEYAGKFFYRATQGNSKGEMKLSSGNKGIITRERRCGTCGCGGRCCTSFFCSVQLQHPVNFLSTRACANKHHWYEISQI